MRLRLDCSAEPLSFTLLLRVLVAHGFGLHLEQ